MKKLISIMILGFASICFAERTETEVIKFNAGIKMADDVLVTNLNTATTLNYILTSSSIVTIKVDSASYSLIVTNPVCQILWDDTLFIANTNQMYHPALTLWAGTNAVSFDPSQVDSNSWAIVADLITDTNIMFMVFSKAPLTTNFFVRGELR